jgi:hypothetical protein
MSFSRRWFWCAAVSLIAAGCGGTGDPRAPGDFRADAASTPDGAAISSDSAGMPDSAFRSGPALDARPGVDLSLDVPSADARPDAQEREAGLRSCQAGGLCRGDGRCERGCVGQQVYRCTCTEGRYVCTGCISVDGGGGPDRVAGPDAGPAVATCAGNLSQAGLRCAHPGDVCHYRGDGGQRLCACGVVGSDRLWICQ